MAHRTNLESNWIVFILTEVATPLNENESINAKFYVKEYFRVLKLLTAPANCLDLDVDFGS